MSQYGSLVGGFLVGFVLVATVSASAQTDPRLTRVISSDAKKFQGELDRAVADGYRFVSGDAGIEIAILERADDGAKRSYIFADDVEKFLKEQQVPAGYRLVASTFGADLYWFGAIFERVDGDDRQRAYRFVKTGSTGGMRKKLEEEGAARGAMVLAVATGGAGVGVMLEDRPNAPNVAVVASGNTGTLSRELSVAASKGFCIVDSDGIKGPFYVLQECESGQAHPAYEVLSTTKAGTFEKELNAAAAKGQRLVASSLIGVEKKALMAYNNELVGVVQSVANGGPAPVYRVFSTVRLSTLAAELEAAAKEGFRFVAFTLGAKESFAVMEKR